MIPFAAGRAADAHQLDEYLQATRIGVEPDRIIVDMTLTPGAAVAKQMFSMLDRDGDGLLSPSETGAYGRRVLRDLVLEFDEQSCPLTLVRAESPSWSEMREGLGAIRVEAEASVALRHGHHRLRFVNNHRAEISVYLVNALKPSTSTISIHARRRDVQQHGIEMDIDRTMPYVSALWVVCPLVAVVTLVIACRPKAG